MVAKTSAMNSVAARVTRARGDLTRKVACLWLTLI
jgi:hypothetical protein